MREGVAPDGSHYYPAFPYTAYTRMSDADILAIKRHIFALAPVAEPSKLHELGFPFDQRWLMWGWKLLFFEPGAFAPDPARSDAWNRGAYLVAAVSHCGDCHPPRNLLGALDLDHWLSGTAPAPPRGHEGQRVPHTPPDQTPGPVP